MRDSEELMNQFRIELKRAVAQRYKRVDLDRFKVELKEHITHFLFEQTQSSPIVIPVVNVINGGRADNSGQNGQTPQAGTNPPASQQPAPAQKTPEQVAAEQQQRFQEMRAKLLNQDPRVD